MDLLSYVKQWEPLPSSNTWTPIDDEPPLNDPEDAWKAGKLNGSLECAQITQAKDVVINGLLARIEVLKHDALTGALTRDGFRDTLSTDPELVQELAAPLYTSQLATSLGVDRILPSGLLWFDTRGVKPINELSYLTGNAFIRIGMLTIALTLAETSRQRPDRRDKRLEAEIATDKRQIERRTIPPKYPDILIRWGGDEMAVLVRQVHEDVLQRIASRLASAFTVERAHERYQNGELPLIVGVSALSITSLLADREGADQPLNAEDMSGLLATLAHMADEDQKVRKAEQYAQMWDAIVTSRHPWRRYIPWGLRQRKQPPEKDIIKQYWKLFFPRFAENPEAFLTTDTAGLVDLRLS